MWVCGQRHSPAALPLRKTRYPLYGRLGSPPRVFLDGFGKPRRKRDSIPGTSGTVATRYTDWAIPTYYVLPVCDRYVCFVGCMTYFLTFNINYCWRTAPLTSKVSFYIFIQQIFGYYKHGIYSPLFSFSKCILFHNSNVFGSCIIHILYTGCAKIKKKDNSGAKRLI